MDLRTMQQLSWARLIVFSIFASFSALAAEAPQKETTPNKAEPPAKPGEAAKNDEAAKNNEAAAVWKGKLPQNFTDLKMWVDLTAKLLEENLFHGAVAVAQQLDLFFVEVNAKEAAYGTFVKAIDKGYPFSIEEFFKTSFFEPDPKSYLGRNYYFYKGKLNIKQKRENWSEYYLSFIKANNFPKFLFFQALKAYEKGDLKEALDLIDQILKKEPLKDQVAFFVKVARTKARILYEQEKYTQSLDIYENFLLKMDPVIATDWIEASWNLYFLKEYERALGILYNVETDTAKQFPNLEKYILRATVYKALCAKNEMANLSQSFETEFGPALEKIKLGQELKSIEALVKIHPKENDEFLKYYVGLNELRREEAQVALVVPANLRPLADQVYKSHEAYLRRMAYTKMLPYLDKAAEQLIILGESLKFLKFDVDRSLYNPDVVFLQEQFAAAVADPLVDAKAPLKGYEVRWQQQGDMWRDEKLAYRARLANQCANP
jgi:tetratricopeptide (TPR) repeat protein